METVQLEWLNQNSLRSYPIREDCSRIPCDAFGNLTDPTLAIPNCVITDFVLVVDSSLINNAVYVSKVAYFGSFLNISIAASENTIATVGVDISQHKTNQAYPFHCLGDYEASSGVIVIGDLSRLSDLLPAGQYSYTSSQTEF